MPRQRNREAPVIPTTALVASSVRYPGKAARIYTQRRDWQAECYRHYEICGEARFAARFYGHAISRATLSTGTYKAGKITPDAGGKASDYLDALFNGKDGQTEMLESIGTHLTVAGECYLVGRVTPEGDLWEVVSVLEMRVTGSNWQIDYGNHTIPVDLTADDVVIRIWNPAPGRRMEADSPFRSLLPILVEIEWLTRHVFAQIQSRLAGAGILFMPDSMTFPAAQDTGAEGRDTTNTADEFTLTLGEAALTPIRDPSSPAALVPIVVTASAEAIAGAKLLKFWSDLDAVAQSLRDEAIRRFALGMDLPPEQILGMGSHGGSGGGRSTGVSHWGAWQIEESTIKLHVEPMLDVVVNALTMGYLRPGLDDGGALVIYDTSALRLRPDRSKEVVELYDRGLLSPDAVLRENGIPDSDRISATELVEWLRIKIAGGSATPEQVAAAAAALGVDLPAGPPVAEVGNEARPTPSLEGHPTRDMPQAATLLHAAEPLVYRALERVGNRLRNEGTRPPGVPAYETHLYVLANGSTTRLMEDAWSCAPQVLAGVADAEVVVPVLNSYVESLLHEQAPHTRERLSQWLALARV